METNTFEAGVATHRIFETAEVITRTLKGDWQMIVSVVIANNGNIDDAAAELRTHEQVVYSVWGMFMRILCAECPEAQELYDECNPKKQKWVN